MSLRRLLWSKSRLRALWSKEDMRGYLNEDGRSPFLLSLFARYADKTDSILELGCGPGRNLLALQGEGYADVYGVDVNLSALNLAKQRLPASEWHRLIHADLEAYALRAEPKSVDILFSMAVLEHLHPASEWIFPLLASVPRKLLITIEDERSSTFMHFPRDYGKVFPGMVLIDSRPCDEIGGLGPGFTARVFRA